MSRRSVYIPDLPPRKQRRSGFVRSEPSWAATPTPSPMPAVAPSTPVEPKPAPEPAAPMSTAAPASRPTPPGKETEPAAPSQVRREVPRWILQVRALDLVELAETVGLEVAEDWLRPCPRCGDEAGAKIYRNKKGWTLWRCNSCKTRDRGNLDMVSYAIGGEKAGDLEPDRKALLQQWFADQGWCDSVMDWGEDRLVH
jgi:hypothetical protein